MKLTTREKENHNMLKLVHPGGFIELHENPILASEVMEKNPRNYVTRPDFFKFPSIVVSPHSVLMPGNVFFIVPCHTIRVLSKTRTNYSTKDEIKSDVLTTNIPAYQVRVPTNYATMSKNSTKNHTLHSRKHTHQSCSKDRDDGISYCNKVQCFKKQSSLSSCANSRTKQQKQKKGEKLDNKPRSLVRARPVYYSSKYSVSTSHDAGKSREWRANSTSTRFHSEQIPKLKPCLKKDHSHDARSRNLKVRFACTDEDANCQQCKLQNQSELDTYSVFGSTSNLVKYGYVLGVLSG